MSYDFEGCMVFTSGAWKPRWQDPCNAGEYLYGCMREVSGAWKPVLPQGIGDCDDEMVGCMKLVSGKWAPVIRFAEYDSLEEMGTACCPGGVQTDMACWPCDAWVDPTLDAWSSAVSYTAGVYVKKAGTGYWADNVWVYKSRAGGNLNHEPVQPGEIIGVPGCPYYEGDAWWKPVAVYLAENTPSNTSWNLAGYGHENGPYPSFLVSIHVEYYELGVKLGEWDFGPVEVTLQFSYPHQGQCDCNYEGTIAPDPPLHYGFNVGIMHVGNVTTVGCWPGCNATASIAMSGSAQCITDDPDGSYGTIWQFAWEPA